MNVSIGMRNLGRVTHVVNVMFKHGFGHLIQELGLKIHLPFKRKVALHKYRKLKTPQVRLRQAFEELGGSYIKLGQLLSLRPDLVPREYCEEFSKLQDTVPPFPVSQVKEIIKKEFGKSVGKMFRSFDSKAFGSASISQVHRATLKSGKRVVVKVQRPNIDKIFASDIDIMYYIAGKLDKTKTFGKYSPLTIVKEFEKYTKKELNFIAEARSIDKFYKNFKNSKTVKIPKVYDEYCSQRVLTIEYLDGVKLKDKRRFNKKKVMKNLVECCAEQVFDQNIFHADMHPGNIILTRGNKIGLIDFGITGSLPEELRKKGRTLYFALINDDIDKVVDALLDIGIESDKTDLDKFRRDVKEIVDEWYGRELSKVRVTHMLRQLFDACVSHGITLPVDMILLAKALLTVEGTALTLDPHFNFVKETEGIIKKIMVKRTVSKKTMDEYLEKVGKLKDVLEKMPVETLAVMDRLKKGIVKIDVEDTDVKTLGLEIDRSSNRLSYALIIAGLVLSAAILMHANIGPYYKGYSASASTLFLIAGFFLLMLIISIWREAKIK